MVSMLNDPLPAVFSEPRLHRAWEYVARKGSAAGIDHESVEDFARRARDVLPHIRSSVLSGSYQPSPLVVFPRAKPSGGFRELTIATVRDRIVGRCAADALVQRFDATFRPQVYAYRPRRSALQAVSAVQRACPVASHVLRLDIESFFDCIDHSLIQEQLRTAGEADAFVELIGRILRQARFDGVSQRVLERGIPQGTQLAPVLSNLALDPLDRALDAAGHRFVRYADDVLVLADGASQAGEALALCNEELARLRLSVNVEKTRVYRIDDGFLFLGFLFNRSGHVASNESRENLRDKLDGGACADETAAEWNTRQTAILRGWTNYFGTPSLPPSHRAPVDETAPSDLPRGIARPGDTDPTDAPTGTDAPTEKNEASEPIPVSPPSLSSDAAGSPSFRERLREIQSTSAACLAVGDTAHLVQALRSLLNDPETPPSENESRDALRLLALAYENLGLAGAARRCRLEAGIGHEPSDERDAEDLPFGLRDVETWRDLFGGGAGPVYIQYVDRLGRCGYRPHADHLSPADLKSHWEGRRTLAAPVYNAAGRVRFAVLDLDITRATLDRLSRDERQKLRNRLLDDARGLLDRAHRLGVEGVLEDSAYKGYHVWFFFRAPLFARRVRAFLQALCNACGEPPSGTHRELFPGSDTCPPDGLGCRFRLPLGVHRLSGERARFLAPDGSPCSAGIEIPGAFAHISGQHLHQALHRLETAFVPPPDRAAAPVIPSHAPSCASLAEPTEPSGTGVDGIGTVVSGCSVLRALRAKAEKTGNLGHAERTILRGILEPAGQEGVELLHCILSRCGNYSRQATNRFLGKAEARPMGCSRIREILGQFADDAGCRCSFKLRKGSYAHPLRHLGRRRDVPTSKAATDDSERANDRERTDEPARSSSDPANPVTASKPTATRSAAAAHSPAEPADGAALAAIAAYRSAREALLAAQRTLLALTGGAPALDTPVGSLRLAGADPEILKWQLDL